MARTPGPHDELADPRVWVEVAARVHRGPALVVVRVTVQHDVGASRVQQPPERSHRARRAAPRGEREPRVVPVREGAGVLRVGMVGEVLREPRVHPVPRPGVRRIGRRSAAPGREAELGVQRDQVPAGVVGTRADVEGVVAEPVRSPRGVAEVPEVPARGRGRIVVVLVVARRGGDLGLRAAPGRIEVAGVGGVRTALVLVVAEQEHTGQVRPVDQVGGVVVLAVRGRTRAVRVVLARDVARGRDDEPRGRRTSGFGAVTGRTRVARARRPGLGSPWPRSRARRAERGFSACPHATDGAATRIRNIPGRSSVRRSNPYRR